MGEMAAIGGSEGGGSPVDLIMLKKTQDLMKQQSAQLLESLPQAAPPPCPPGVGGVIDIRA